MVRSTLLPNLNIYVHHVSQIEGTGVTVEVHVVGGRKTTVTAVWVVDKYIVCPDDGGSVYL